MNCLKGLIRNFSVRSSALYSTPLIITLAPTGNVPTKALNKNLPYSPEEIARDCISAYKLGARLFHIHARIRDSKEKPTHDLDTFRSICSLLKKSIPDGIIQISTGGRAGFDDDARCNVIRLCPEMGSFTTGSNNLANVVYANSAAFLKKLGSVYRDTKVKPEIECFDVGHITNAVFLVRKGLLSLPLHFDFVMGTNGGMPADVHTLSHCVRALPPNSTWTCAAMSTMNTKLAAAAIVMGGNVRIGLEDAIYDDDGKQTNNTELVEKIVELSQFLRRKIATADEAREILSLPFEYKNRILPYLDKNAPLAPIL